MKPVRLTSLPVDRFFEPVISSHMSIDHVPSVLHQCSLTCGWCLLVAALLLGSTLGCEQQTSTAGVTPDATDIAGNADPAASFARIIAVFRREVENTPGGFTSQHQGAFSKLRIDRKVREEMFPPETPNDNYRARITVETKSTYTYRPPLSTAGEDEPEQESQRTDDQDDLGLGDGGGATLPDFDINLPATEPRVDPAIAKPVISDRPDEYVEHYDLEYEGDRWVLKTQLDPETEGFIKTTFEYALGRQ